MTNEKTVPTEPALNRDGVSSSGSSLGSPGVTWSDRAVLALAILALMVSCLAFGMTIATTLQRAWQQPAVEQTTTSKMPTF